MRLGAYETAMRACELSRERWNAAREAEKVETPARRASGLQLRTWKGAEQSRIYSDWITTLLSPHAELSGSVRQLRARARELARNNPYAGGYLEHISTNLLGAHGMRLRAKARDGRGNLLTELNAHIEERWIDFWMNGAVTADGTMSGLEYSDLALQTVAREGEAFPRRLVGRDFRHGLGLQLVDPDLIDDSYNLNGPGLDVEVYSGVEVDRVGRRLAFHVLDYYQYGPGLGGRGRTRIPAGEMLHLYRAKRANQMRGVTWLARAMAALHDLERYQQNELVAAAAGAAKMGFIINEGGPIGSMGDDPVTDGAAAQTSDAGAGGSRVSVEAEPGTIWELEQGQKFESWSPDHPSTAFADFTRSVLRSAAAGLGVSYETLSSDMSQVSYLSARAGLLIERAIYQRLQQWWIRVFQQPILEWWLESASLTGDLELPGDWRQYRNVLWIPRGFAWVDPQKDATAAETELDLRLTTRTRLAAARGDDYEEILEELKREQELAKQYGVEISAPASPANTPPASADEDEEDAEEPEAPSRNGHGTRAAGGVFARG